MVLPFELRFSSVWRLCWCCMLLVRGYRACQSRRLSRRNVTTELGSDVLLPCNFEQTLLGSDKTADIAAVWSQTNIMTDNLLEIKLQGVVLFWSNRGGRIKPFSKLSESGNFSILLHNVSQTDLGLYRCQLFDGINCSLAYQEVQLDLATVHEHQTSIIAGTSGAVGFLLLACVFYVECKRRPRMRQEDIRDDPVYESISYTVQDEEKLDDASPPSEGVCDNPIYVTAGDLEEPERRRTMEYDTR